MDRAARAPRAGCRPPRPAPHRRAGPACSAWPRRPIGARRPEPLRPRLRLMIEAPCARQSRTAAATSSSEACREAPRASSVHPRVGRIRVRQSAHSPGSGASERAASISETRAPWLCWSAQESSPGPERSVIVPAPQRESAEGSTGPSMIATVTCGLPCVRCLSSLRPIRCSRPSRGFPAVDNPNPQADKSRTKKIPSSVSHETARKRASVTSGAESGTGRRPRWESHQNGVWLLFRSSRARSNPARAARSKGALRGGRIPAGPGSRIAPCPRGTEERARRQLRPLAEPRRPRGSRRRWFELFRPIEPDSWRSAEPDRPACGRPEYRTRRPRPPLPYPISHGDAGLPAATKPAD